MPEQRYSPPLTKAKNSGRQIVVERQLGQLEIAPIRVSQSNSCGHQTATMRSPSPLGLPCGPDPACNTVDRAPPPRDLM